MDTRTRSWIFTRFNYDDKVIDAFKSKGFDYLLFGKEICPTTGRPHLQGCFYTRNKVTFGSLKKWDPEGSFRVMNGTWEENYTYCTKDKIFEEYGTRPQQGKRTDLDVVRELVDSGESMRSCLRQLQSPGSVRFMQLYIEYNEKKRNWKPEVIWLYGATGTGKTRRAIERFADQDVYLFTPNDGSWWNGYDAHSVVIMDDIRPDTFKFNYFLTLLDRNSVQVKVKGGMRQFVPKNIVITCPYPPTHFVSGGEDPEQLTRRIDRIIKVESLDQEIIL